MFFHDLFRNISTHALHAESDTTYVLCKLCGKKISTHALHAESDPVLNL